MTTRARPKAEPKPTEHVVTYAEYRDAVDAADKLLDPTWITHGMTPVREGSVAELGAIVQRERPDWASSRGTDWYEY